MSFMDLCLREEAEPKDWKDFLDDVKSKQETMPQHSVLGIFKEEYEDLSTGMRTFAFYVFKRKCFKYDIFKLWPGSYIKFAIEYDGGEPHIEYGWIDVISTGGGLVRVQCDDTYFGMRAVTIRNTDVIELLPHKERPLIYYKTMICGECKKCNHNYNDFPSDCPKFLFFNAIANKQNTDIEFLKVYNKVLEKNNESKGKTGNTEK